MIQAPPTVRRSELRCRRQDSDKKQALGSVLTSAVERGECLALFPGNR